MEGLGECGCTAHVGRTRAPSSLRLLEPPSKVSEETFWGGLEDSVQATRRARWAGLGREQVWRSPVCC